MPARHSSNDHNSYYGDYHCYVSYLDCHWGRFDSKRGADPDHWLW